MSEDERLERLGLLHLKDKPEELAKELERRRQEFDRRADEWEKERQRRRSTAESAGRGEGAAAGPPLTYCVHCGTKVNAYSAGSVSGDDLYIHGVQQPPDETFRCPRCGDHPSPFMNGTGRQCTRCNELSPFPLVFCAYCGTRLP
jgi:hypothetical protein